MVRISGRNLVDQPDLNFDNHMMRKSTDVIGLIRIYCQRDDAFVLVDVAAKDASQTADQLMNEGWDIEAEIPV